MDPYYDVQSDTLNLIKQLQATHDTIQQRHLIAEIRNQIVDLDEMIVLISKHRDRFRISDRELQIRKQFIKEVKAMVSTNQAQMNKMQLIDTHFETPVPETVEGDESVQTYVKSNMVEQDQYLDEIGRSLDVLKQINHQISDELTVQNDVIDDLSQLTEKTEDRLR